ncbi:uroporphyrinogen-III synthase [Saccharospirillum impatiens]|uniref:uroporphyrinogen-III synthase n=1 Tax=Saccharospirillum impatiens TaxID=169438 RepID=UPI0003FBA803|nr:uroporphyrinogen-III synthase [Saccharospirillum impatiens]
MRLLLAKARSDWARWQSYLDPHAELMLHDPWQLTLSPETPERRSLWLNLDEYQGVICVSPTAASQLTAALDHYWPQPPQGVLWVCNGPATAEVLGRGGLTPVFPVSGHTAEDVLSLLSTLNVAQRKWLVVKGVGGRDLYPRELRDRGAQVQTMDVYERALDPAILEHMSRSSSQADAVLVSSQMLGEALLAGENSRWLNWPGLWVLTSPRLMDWARDQGIGRSLGTPGASPEAVAQALGKL